MLQQDSDLERAIELAAGSSLPALAQQHLGDYSKWRELAELNGIDIFQALPTGQRLVIPSAEQLQELAQQRLTQLLGQTTGSDASTRLQRLIEQGISAANLPELDLSSLKTANPYGQYPWQIISWILQ